MQSIEIVIIELLWDDWNIEHIARHDVVPDEVELSLTDEHAVFLKAKENRVMVLGRAGDRLISTVMNEQATKGQYYVITARDMSKKERAFYRAQKGKHDE
ncbi:MAG: BrnT family toxin [Anaerolineales bacterium]|nr:BrnT family toxin [Anaerolineales bacterium]